MPASAPKERLTEAAAVLFHQHGVRRTTLAEIAQAAAVPLGNVYYHFRTKDALIEAVTTRYAEGLRAAFTQYELAHPEDALAVFRAFLAGARSNLSNLARFGCPYGALCQELEKVASAEVVHARALLELHLEWFARQFRRLGKEAQAQGLAEELLVRLQGAYVVASSLQSPDFLDKQLVQIEAWIERLA